MTPTGYVLQCVPVGRENARTSHQIYESLRASSQCINRRDVSTTLKYLWKRGIVRREKISGVLSHYLYWRDPE